MRLCLLIALAPAALAIEPVHEFTFNDPGSVTTQSSGSEPAQGQMISNEQKPARLFSEPGGGVSGQPGDYAFANTDAPAMGTAPGGVVKVPVDDSQLEGVRSLTITGWYKTAESTPVDDSAVLINYGSKDQAGGVILRAYRPGTATLQARVNGEQVVAPGMRSFPEANRWVFFAFSLNLTQPGEATALLYHGTADRPAEVVGTGASDAAMIHAEGTPLFIGAATDMGHRPFHGWMDNIRIYLDHHGSAGALDSDAIEKVRLADLENTPPQLP